MKLNTFTLISCFTLILSWSFSPTETSIQKPSFKKEMMSSKGTKQFNVEIMNCLEQAFQAISSRCCCIREAFLIFFTFEGLLAVMITSQEHLHKNCMYSHGTLRWLVSCRYKKSVTIVNALLSKECYFSHDLFLLAEDLVYSFGVTFPSAQRT